MSIARNQEQVTAWGWAKQADIVTANVLGGIKRFTRTNGAFVNRELVTESDAPEYGKGHEFQTASYNTSWNCNGSIEAYLSSELLAWAACFCLGTVVESPAGTYTITPLVPTTSLELPYFSYLQAVRQGESSLVDEMLVGQAVNDFLVKVGYGPGRANSTLTVHMIGSGKCTDPSGITIPSLTTVHLLSSASVAFTAIGMDYVTLKRIISLEWGWNNNILGDFGFYPGSGTQATVGGALRGRLLVGTRVPILRWVALIESSSTEMTKLLAGTTGTTVITQTNTSAETYTATFQQTKIMKVEMSEVEGFLAVTCEAVPEYHSSNGVLTVVAKTALTGCCQ